MLRHSAFRGAKVARWYNQHDPKNWLWLDVAFPHDDTRESFTIEYHVGLPFSNAIDAENELIGEALAGNGGDTLPPPITPTAVGERVLEKRIRELEVQNTRLVARLLGLGWRPEAPSS